jgi:hypothetical protein
MNRAPIFTAVAAAIRRFALPVAAAWLLRVGTDAMIVSVSRVASSWLTQFVNFVIRRSFPDTIEIEPSFWRWQVTTGSLVLGVLTIGLGLAAGQWAYARRRSQEK